MSLKGRINRLEKDHVPKRAPVKYIVDWGDATGDPVKEAELRANRPTHDEDGNPITYIDWHDDPEIPGPDVDDETRIDWANDVLSADESDENSTD